MRKISINACLFIFWENPVQRDNSNANDFNLRAMAPTYLIKPEKEELKIHCLCKSKLSELLSTGVTLSLIELHYFTSSSKLQIMLIKNEIIILFLAFTLEVHWA